jgi:hypothetical protein
VLILLAFVIVSPSVSASDVVDDRCEYPEHPCPDGGCRAGPCGPPSLLDELALLDQG